MQDMASAVLMEMDDEEVEDDDDFDPNGGVGGGLRREVCSSMTSTAPSASVSCRCSVISKLVELVSDDLLPVKR